MEAVTCPGCKRLFCVTTLFGDDEDEDDGDRVTCPFCLRMFDPYATPTRRDRSDASAGLEDLVGDDEEKSDDW